jgi:hypothetical protein
MRRVPTEELSGEHAGEPSPSAMPGLPFTTHRELVQQMQRASGQSTEDVAVHLHPRLARMVCLWAAHRRWAITRKHFKLNLTANMRKWHTGFENKRRSDGAATVPLWRWGYNSLKWPGIWRVVGLSPWGEQLQLRVKHHAPLA